ncbi:MAG: hypothetical protein D6761_00490 [Candidatus Dadabacteria bacterium]|nr:MAG: hypothetical protein D6761_00490 [Candidatus Dadabacteria bacterium]
MRTAAAVAATLLTGCSLSTVAGPVWQERGGAAPAALCIYAGDFETAGDPWLAQRAREALLARARQARAQCEVQQIRVDVDGIAVSVGTDAYGPAPDLQKDSAPQPARMQVALSGTLRWLPCGALSERARSIRADEWMPYSSDPYQVEERAASRLDLLAARWWDQAALLIARHGCLTDATDGVSHE